MLERRSPLHQGMALHVSDASTAGLRVLAVLHSASGAAAEQAVLWPLCAQNHASPSYTLWLPQREGAERPDEFTTRSGPAFQMEGQPLAGSNIPWH